MTDVLTTTVTVETMIDRAVRRCGVAPSAITPELLENCKENLFMLITSMGIDGLSLWLMDQQYMTLAAGQRTYVLPNGTVDVTNMQLCRPTVVTTGSVSWFAVQFDVPPVGTTFTLEASDDSFVTTVDLGTFTVPALGALQWFKLDPIADYLEYRVTGSAVLTLASDVYSIPIVPINRDDFSNMPRKEFTSQLPTNYWFEKLEVPQFTLWPVPDNQELFVTVYRTRQTQRIDSLNTSLEIPVRWYNAVVWQLAAVLAFELPGVGTERMNMVLGMADKNTIPAYNSENDGAPFFLQPRIGVYTA